MQLISKLKCLLRGHSLGPIEPDGFWFSTTCQCCGTTFTGDSALELAMFMPLKAMQLESPKASFVTQDFSRVATTSSI